MHCPKLEGLTFSNTAEEIVEKAFQMCLALKYVKGLSAVTTIGDAAFQYCTSLENIDVVPGNVTLGNWVFILTPNDAKAGDTVLMNALWKGQGEVCFAQNEWTSDQLSAIQAVTGQSVKFSIPESDNQGTDFYKQWGAFPWPYNDLHKDTGHPASGCCGIFSLYHIHNILHPNSEYDTFYDWMMREIVPHKITVTQSLYDALNNSGYLPELITYNPNISYEVGSEITARDLPMALDIYSETWGKEGTAFWGCCEAMGWTATKTLFDSSVESGAKVKRIVLDNLAANKPVEMEIVGAAYGVHGMHAVVAIGYDAETDKLLIIDSTGGFDADVIPLAYWCSFESLITPHEASAIWTFDFGEVITMTDVDNKLNKLLLDTSFRIEKGVFTIEGSDILMGESEIDEELPCVINGVAKTMRVVSKDEVLQLTIPTSANVKALVIQPEQAVIDDVKSIAPEWTTSKPTGEGIDKQWFLGLSCNTEYKIGSTGVYGFIIYIDLYEQVVSDTLYYFWTDFAKHCTCVVDESGFTCKITSLKQGSYNIIAYYWDESAASILANGDTIGDIDSALGSIIAIQNELIGGETE